MAVFSKFSGFDPPIIENLNKRDRLKLEISSAWALLGVILASFSAGYIFYFCMNSWIAGLFTGIFIALILYTLQIALISGTLGNVELETVEFEKKKNVKLKLLLFIIPAFLLSQPILFLSYKYSYPAEIRKITQDDKQLRKSFKEKFFKERIALYQREIAYNKEYLNQLSDLNAPLSLKQNQEKEAAFLSNNRKALVIGNQSYPTALLQNPLKDAKDLTASLEKIGFSVKTVFDGNQIQMEKALVDYYKALKPGDISFIYFSGHGFQDHGNNYLVPVDFDLSDKSKAVALNVIIESMSHKALLANVLVVDACRSYTFGSAGGLASTEAGINTYIALAAKPGQFSLDGKPGTNGVFTAAVLKNINQRVDIDTVFREVRKDVLKSSGNKQETWTSHSLNGALILASGRAENVNEMIGQNDAEAIGLSGISCTKIEESSSDAYKRAQLRSCGTARAIKLQDDLLAYQESVKKTLTEFDQKNHSSFTTRGDVLNAFYSVLKHPFFTLLGTLIISFILSGGFVWRDVLGKEFLKYEISFHEAQRQRVFETASNYTSIAEKLPFANRDFVKKSFEVNYLNSRPEASNIVRGSKAKDMVMGKFK